jgi:threonyl-tRNA synthetase
LQAHGDYSPEKIGSKIRTAQLEKIPYILVVGEKEQLAGAVAIYHRSAGDQGVVVLAEFIARLEGEVEDKLH